MKGTARKVMLAVYGTLLVLSVALIAWSHRSTLKDLRYEAISHLGGITTTLSAQMDGGRVTRLLEKYDGRGSIVRSTQDAYYYVMHETLRKSAELNHLDQPLTIVAFDQRADELQTIVTSNTDPEYRRTYPGAGAAELIAYLGADRVDASSSDVNGELASFTALRDGRGHITGAIVAVLSEDDLLQVAQAKLWRNIGIAAIVFMLAGIFLFRSVGRWVQHEENERAAWQQRHEGVADSIAYARRIQGALVPKPEALRERFDRYFVVNRPKDVVSGDFLWFHHLDNDRCLVAVADCTGHGVPGAMMATLGCSLLNELVLQDPWRDPAEMLYQLNLRLVQSLHQSGQRKGAGEGMDVALCRIDNHEREIIFSGAFRPLYWVHDGQLTVINGDRKPIGGSHFEPDRKFTAHRIAYHPGDRVYLFSDGYVDQFGGPERKKFMAARFNALLLAEQHLNMDAQAELLSRVFDEWKGAEEQVDDVCVLGLEMRA